MVLAGSTVLLGGESCESDIWGGNLPLSLILQVTFAGSLGLCSYENALKWICEECSRLGLFDDGDCIVDVGYPIAIAPIGWKLLGI